MKILIGICGIGNGHLNRQTSVINYLLNCGHSIVVATTDNNLEYFRKTFENTKIIDINIPWITCNTSGIDFRDSLNKYINNNVDQYKSFFEFAINVEDAFNGIPDIVITDYEPNVAQYSYAVDIPLLCMEQQSKFLFLQEEKIKNFSIIEEKRRINYFFPKYDKKIISSFFPLKIKDKKTKIVPPIISELNLVNKKDNQVLVYFSPYSDSSKYKLVLEAISKIEYLNFIVYSNQKFIGYDKKNINFKAFGNTFKKDLENSLFLITTAGHQLLSESISINIPSYLIPLDTYEQNYNALMIQKYNLGIIGKKITQKEIVSFYKNINIYSTNIEKFKNKFYKHDWKNTLKEILESYENK